MTWHSCQAARVANLLAQQWLTSFFLSPNINSQNWTLFWSCFHSFFQVLLGPRFGIRFGPQSGELCCCPQSFCTVSQNPPLKRTQSEAGPSLGGETKFRKRHRSRKWEEENFSARRRHERRWRQKHAAKQTMPRSVRHANYVVASKTTKSRVY